MPVARGRRITRSTVTGARRVQVAMAAGVVVAAAVIVPMVNVAVVAMTATVVITAVRVLLTAGRCDLGPGIVPVGAEVGVPVDPGNAPGIAVQVRGPIDPGTAGQSGEGEERDGRAERAHHLHPTQPWAARMRGTA
jgi:hypothetical protein